MRSIFPAAALLAALSGCETTPESIRQTTEPFRVAGPGRRPEVAACVLRKGEKELRAVGALRPDIDPGTTELIWSSEACVGACAIAQVQDADAGKVTVAYWLAGDMLFRGTIRENMHTTISACLR